MFEKLGNWYVLRNCYGTYYKIHEKYVNNNMIEVLKAASEPVTIDIHCVIEAYSNWEGCTGVTNINGMKYCKINYMEYMYRSEYENLVKEQSV